jgi:hypothetical protein
MWAHRGGVCGAFLNFDIWTGVFYYVCIVRQRKIKY